MHPHHLAASALILPLIIVTLGYIAACAGLAVRRLPQMPGRGPPPLPVRPRLAVLPPLPAAPEPGCAPAAASGTTSATCTRKATDDHPPRPGTRTADLGTGPDQPVPFTLTPKAHALLDQVPEGQWACTGCGDAWFGAPPDDGLCPACRPGQEHP